MGGIFERLVTVRTHSWLAQRVGSSIMEMFTIKFSTKLIGREEQRENKKDADKKGGMGLVCGKVLVVRGLLGQVFVEVLSLCTILARHVSIIW